jgi:hypothetical protein
VFNVRQWYYELQQHYNKSRAKEMSLSPMTSLASSSANLHQSGHQHHHRSATNSNDAAQHLSRQHTMSERVGLVKSGSDGTHDATSHVMHGHLNMSTLLSQAAEEEEEYE